MAKTKVSQFDAVASNNTDINSVNVAEGCPPSGINNAIREMASLLKKQEVGTDAMTSPDIDGGTIDGATIGGSSGVTIGVSDGTVSAPSIKFTGDTNTGIYRGGTDILKFVTAGTDRLTILANGDVGIGTSPSHDLHVKSDGNTKVKFEGNLNSNTSDLLLSHSSTGDSGLQFNSNQLNMFTYGDMTFNAGTGNLSGGYPANERMRIKNTGVNVGIGNTFAHSFNAQANQLVVGTGSGANGITIYSGSDSTGDIFFADGFNASDETRGGINYNHTNNYMNFRVNDAPKMYILSSGDVGIGTSSPNAKLTSRTTDGGSAFSIHRDFSGDVGGAETGTGSFNFTLTDTATSDQIVSRINSVAVAGTGDAFAGSMRFFTAGTNGSIAERMRVTGDGIDFRNVSGTSYVLMKNGDGIHFGATSGGSGTTVAGTVLDDYEEGTFTATITAESGSITSYSVASATYTKIGDTVHLHCRFSVSNKGTGTNFIVSGFPFTSAREPLGTFAETNTTGLTGFMFNAGTNANAFTSRRADGWGNNCLVNGSYTVNVTYRV